MSQPVYAVTGVAPAMRRCLQTGLAGCRIAPERSLTLSLNDGERVTDDGEVARATRAVPAVRSGRESTARLAFAGC